MKKLSRLTKTAYGIGNLGYGTLSQALNSFVMFFATAVLGMSGALVGLAVGISALWDGVSDPIVGFISDRSKNTGLGRRLRFMFIATFTMALSNIFLWVIPTSAPSIVKFFWLLLALLGIETSCTLFATPYFALGVDLAPDYSEQNVIQGYKTVFFILGMLLPSFLMMWFMPANNTMQSQFNQLGYIKIGLVTSFLSLACGLISTFGTLKAYKKIKFPVNMHQKQNQSFFKTLKKFFNVLKQKNYFSVIIGYSVALIASAFLISVGMHLFTYAYHFNSTQIPILMAVLFISAIISQPFWIYLANRGEKKSALNSSLITVLFGIALTVVTFIFRDFISNKALFLLTLPCIFVCGFGTGSLYSLPLSMFADVLTMDNIKTGENNSATYSGFMTISYNLANSIALFLIGLLLDFIKFDASQPVQPLTVQNNLGLIVFLGCACSISLSMLFFSQYSLKRKDILKAQMNSEFKILKIENVQKNTNETGASQENKVSGVNKI
ncbi:MAG: MFS transporter [Christensenellales bacterium]|jgi:GPH family glycoside/pentoside/hexuronide:cation symporter